MTFFPLGLVLSFILHSGRIIKIPEIPYLKDLTFAPYAVAIFGAIMSGSALFTIKNRHKKFKFEHFYLLMIGMVLILIGGGLLLIIDLGKYDDDSNTFLNLIKIIIM